MLSSGFGRAALSCDQRSWVRVRSARKPCLERSTLRLEDEHAVAVAEKTVAGVDGVSIGVKG
jgi:hypothetical protein